MDDAFFRLFQQHGAGISRGAAIESPYIARGLWVPVIQGSTLAGTYTYYVQEGAFLILEEYVYVTAHVGINAITVAPTGVIQIAGLPVAGIAIGASGISGSINFGLWQGPTLAGGRTQLSARVIAATTYMRLIQCGSALAAAELGAGGFGLVGGIVDFELEGWYKYA